MVAHYRAAGRSGVVPSAPVFVRNRHVVLFGAQRPFGRRLTEALLALGAQVVAVGPLRTELEALRAELRQHERLHVAECSPDDVGPALLLEATLRRGHLDALVFVADEDPRSLSEGDALSRAIGSLPAGAPLQRLFAYPAPTAHVDSLAPPTYPRNFDDALGYDPSNLTPSVSLMLERLSQPPST